MKRLLIVNSDAKESSYGGVAPFMRNMHPYLKEEFDVTYLYPLNQKHGSWVPNRISTFIFFWRHRMEMMEYDFVLSHIAEASYVLSFLGVPFAHIFHGNDNPMSVSRFKGAMIFSWVYDMMYHRIDCKATLRYTVGAVINGRSKIYNPIIRTASALPYYERKGFVFAGRLEAMKRVERLIAVYALLPDSIKEENDFYIAGSGTKEADLRACARERGVEDKVHFVGDVPNQEMQAFDAQHKLLLMASTREGMPTAIAEALTVGLPVVSTDVGDIRSVINSGQNGYLLPKEFKDRDFANAICTILKTYDRFSDAAIKTSTLFDAKRVVGKIIEDIKDVIER